MKRGVIGLVLLASFLWPLISRSQVSFDRILRAVQEPQNWLTYSGTTLSQRHSLLRQINPANVKILELQWIYQARSLEKFEATALVVDGVMFTVQAPNDVIALDAATGRVFWIFSHAPEPWTKPCCGHVNRGLAILGDTLFMATIDAHLIAIDAKNGRPLWDTTVADAKSGYALTLAPLVVKDKVIVGTAGGIMASAASLPPTMSTPARKRGVSTLSPNQAAQAGEATLGRRGVVRCGLLVLMTRLST